MSGTERESVLPERKRKSEVRRLGLQTIIHLSDVRTLFMVIWGYRRKYVSKSWITKENWFFSESDEIAKDERMEIIYSSVCMNTWFDVCCIKISQGIDGFVCVCFDTLLNFFCTYTHCLKYDRIMDNEKCFNKTDEKCRLTISNVTRFFQVNPGQLRKCSSTSHCNEIFLCLFEESVF